MNKIEINEANGNLIQLIDQLEKNTVDKHILLRNGKPIATIQLYKEDKDNEFPEIGGEDWDKLDDNMKKYWSDFGDEEI